MSLLGEQVLLRAYLQSADRTPHAPTYEQIVKSARSEGLAGCTVLRGIMGFGRHGLIPQRIWSLVEHVPIILEIVDRSERIRAFVQTTLPRVMVGGMITLERANVMMYRQRSHDQPSSLRLASLLNQPLSTIPRIEVRDHMSIVENGVLLRVFAGESDRLEGKPLHQAILQEARQQGLAGGTVLRGTEGFGANSVVHKSKLLEMSSDLPIVIEIVDTEEKIKRLLPFLEQVVREGMITMEHVAMILYRHKPNDTPTASDNH